MRTAGLILTFNTIEHFVVPVVDLENYIYIIMGFSFFGGGKKSKNKNKKTREEERKKNGRKN